jgi:hypothetical protein
MVTEKKRPRRRPRGPKLTRDLVIFTVGILGIIHEAVIEQAERPFLLAVFAAMIGLPAFLRVDERKDDDSE